MGGRTPEELEALLEDALLVGDPQAVSVLFERAAILALGDTVWRGTRQIRHAADDICGRHLTYVSDGRSILRAGATALIVATTATNVLRRGDDGLWRYAVVAYDTTRSAKPS